MNFLHNYDIGNQDPKGTRSGGVGWRGCGSICGYKVVEINTLNFKRVQELCVSCGRPGEQVIYVVCVAKFTNRLDFYMSGGYDPWICMEELHNHYLYPGFRSRRILLTDSLRESKKVLNYEKRYY